MTGRRAAVGARIPTASTTLATFPGFADLKRSEYNDSEIACAVKPQLMITPREDRVSYDLFLVPE